MRTGFIYGYPNKPIKKRYSYHGLNRDCLIQPDPEPFIDPLIDFPYGPIQDINFRSVMNVGLVQYKQWDYAWVHNNPISGTYMSGCGQDLDSSGRYIIWRQAVVFSTSVLPDNAYIVSAQLRVRQSSYLSNKVFEVVIQNGQPTYPHYGVIPADYFYGNYSGNGGSVIASYTSYCTIEMNPEGLSWINRSGYTKFILRSDRDIGYNLPNYRERVLFSPHYNTAYLKVYYKVPL